MDAFSKAWHSLPFEASKLKRWPWFEGTCYVQLCTDLRLNRQLRMKAQGPWSIRRWWICPSCKKRTRIGIAQCSATRSFATALVTTEKIAMCALQWKDCCNYRCHSRRFLYSYDSYQVLARERLSMLVSDFTWKVGGMSSQFFLISQSHAMMQLFNDTCQSE